MKMENYGIRGNTWRWVRSFLSDRTQQVLLDVEKSSQLPVVSGVPQGSVLGTLLFGYSSMTIQHQFHLKLDFSQMTVYCTGTYTQRMTLKSCKKTYIALKSGRKHGVWKSIRGNVTRCLNTRARSPFEHRYTLKGHILEDVKEAKYLELTLSSNLTWNTHIGNITSKANKLLEFLRRNLKIRNESMKENAYKAIVRSNLEYCSTVWAPHTKKNKDEIEKVQRREARFVRGRYHNTIDR
jgi:hypothetical protein